MTSGLKTKQEDILRKPDVKRVIESLCNQKTIPEISLEQNVHPSTIYRIIRQLCDYNIFKIDAYVIKNGRKCRLYKVNNMVKSIA